MFTFTDEDLTARRAKLNDELGNKICIIEFVKVNGELREMPCTLDTAYLPPVALNEHHSTKLFKPEVMSVWCTNAEGWRSFRVENVISIRTKD